MNTPSDDSDPLNAVYDTLACAYRRRIMRYLVTAEDDVATVEELIDALLDHDNITEERSHVAIKLHHAALPKLAARGFIEYDDRSETIRYRESPVLERELRRSADATVVT